MRLPDQTVSSDVLMSYAVYTAVRLEARKETKELAIPLRSAIDDLKKKNHNTKEKSLNVSSKLAIRDEKDNDCDKSIMALSLELLSVVGNDRENPRYRSIFFKTPSAITNEPIKDELNDLKILEERLKANPNDEIYKKHLPIIQSMRLELEQAQAEFENSVNDGKNYYGIEKLSQSELRRVLVKVYGKLVELKGKKEAENYFKKFTTKKKLNNTK